MTESISYSLFRIKTCLNKIIPDASFLFFLGWIKHQKIDSRMMRFNKTLGKICEFSLWGAFSRSVHLCGFRVGARRKKTQGRESAALYPEWIWPGFMSFVDVLARSRVTFEWFGLTPFSCLFSLINFQLFSGQDFLETFQSFWWPHF